MLKLKPTNDSDSDQPRQSSAVKSGSPAALGFKIASHSDCESEQDGQDSFFNNNSEEERDQMIMIADVDRVEQQVAEENTSFSCARSQLEFRQLDYLWLFDPYMDFRKREDFKLDDSMLSINDYERMRKLNRALLTAFLAQVQETESVREAQEFFSENFELDDQLIEEEKWADECIDEELKTLLVKKFNGQYLGVDLIAHMDYFYNTLDCHFQTESPFQSLKKYPALVFPTPCQQQVDGDHTLMSPPAKKTMPLVSKYHRVIYPQHYQDGSKQSSTQDGSTALVQQPDLPKKYVWYPNTKLGSPVKTAKAVSPVPKTVSSYFRHKSVLVRNDPMTPQSQLNRAGVGALTKRAAGCQKTETFGQISSAVKQSAQKRESGSVCEGSMFSPPTPKILPGQGCKSVLMDDEDFEEMTSFL